MKKLMLIVVMFVSIFINIPGVFGRNERVGENISDKVFAEMPIKEVTVFKDGHAFVLHEGLMPTNENGSIVLDYLPTPIVGTFWAYSADPKAELAAITSSKRIVSIEKTALTIPEMIEGNVGARVRIRDKNHTDPYEATILRIPARSSVELSQTSPPGSPQKLPKQSDIVLLQVAAGIRAVPINQILEVTFLDEPKSVVSREEFRNLMTLKLNWNKAKHEKLANVEWFMFRGGFAGFPAIVSI